MDAGHDLCRPNFQTMKKPYTSAPLPFMGQKRRFAKEFRQALHEFETATVFVDLFGGSGLLSHYAKHERPDARVIYNDFDDYHLRLENIDRTNALLAEIRTAIGNYPQHKKLPDEMRQTILDLAHRAGSEGFVDYVTISSAVLFSSKYVTDFDGLQKEGLYNNIRDSNYCCDGYLDGIEIVKGDYRELFEQYKNIPGVVFLVDPPYLSTEVGVYKCRWRLSDYLDVLTILKDASYFYFTSSKSSLVELCEWIAEARVNTNPFVGAVRKEKHVQINYTSKYTDIMLYRP